jgi:hypothetical protein
VEYLGTLQIVPKWEFSTIKTTIDSEPVKKKMRVQCEIASAVLKFKASAPSQTLPTLASFKMLLKENKKSSLQTKITTRTRTMISL